MSYKSALRIIGAAIKELLFFLVLLSVLPKGPRRSAVLTLSLRAKHSADDKSKDWDCSLSVRCELKTQWNWSESITELPRRLGAQCEYPYTPHPPAELLICSGLTRYESFLSAVLTQYILKRSPEKQLFCLDCQSIFFFQSEKSKVSVLSWYFLVSGQRARLSCLLTARYRQQCCWGSLLKSYVLLSKMLVMHYVQLLLSGKREMNT